MAIYMQQNNEQEQALKQKFSCICLYLNVNEWIRKSLLRLLPFYWLSFCSVMYTLQVNWYEYEQWTKQKTNNKKKTQIKN